MTRQLEKTEHQCPMCQHIFEDDKQNEANKICGAKRPPRDVLCQLQWGHAGKHIAVIF